MSLRIRKFLCPANATQFFSDFFSCWKHRNSSFLQSCNSTLFMHPWRFKLPKIKLSWFGPPSFLSEWYDWTLHKICHYPCLKLLIQFMEGWGGGGGGSSLTKTYKTCNSALMKSCFPWTPILVSIAQASGVRPQASNSCHVWHWRTNSSAW